MKVHIAQKAGFCMGVRRAVDLTLDLVNKEQGPISTYGPLIHNPQVLGVLENKGVGVSKRAPAHPGQGTVIIRAHGVPPQEKARLEDSGLTVRDATCPRVLKVQAIIRRHRKEGRTTVIIGDRNHAEVLGLMGYAGDDCHVVSREEDIDKLVLDRPYIVVSQTTQDEDSFERLSEMIHARFPGGKIFNTICDSTHKRQDEVKKLCGRVEALVVVGGKTSANTKRLAEIAGEMGVDVFLVETEEELDLAAFGKYDEVGVTAGASTPSWMINRVVRVLEGVPGRSEGWGKAVAFKTVQLLMATNAYVAVAGALLTAAWARLLGLPISAESAGVACGYLFAMHNFNRLAGGGSDTFHDPMLSAFRVRYRRPLLLVSSAALVFAFFLTFRQGRLPFILFAAMSVFGLLYSTPILPRRLPVTRLKEIPGSKTALVALAWALVVAVLPALGHEIPWPRVASAFVVVLLMVMVRNALFDIFQVQGDRIAGRETLPVVIGVDKTMSVLNIVLAVIAFLGVVLPAAGLLAAPAGYGVLAGALYLGAYLVLYRRGRVTSGARAEFALETAFVWTAFFILALGAVGPGAVTSVGM